MKKLLSVGITEDKFIALNNANFLDTNMSILQGMYIRDNISEECIMNNLFIEKLNMKIVSHIWSMDSDYDIYSQSSEMQKKIEKYICEKIEKLDNNEVNLIYIRIPGHINGLYIDLKNDNKKYYLYEPHIPNISSEHNKQYPLLQYIMTSCEKKGIMKQDLPHYILKQQSLPLCYMYVLHLFVYLYMIDNKLIECKTIECENDVEIIDFTRFIIDQCFKCDMIKSEDYFLLTNKICQFNLLPNKKYDCKYIFLRSCNPNTILSFFQNNDKLQIDFSQIKTLHNDVNFYYFIDFIHNAISLQRHEVYGNISEFNKYQIILLILTMKHCFGCNFSYTNNINELFSRIQEDIFVDAIKESDILVTFYVYDFYIAILDLVKNNKNKKEIIDRIYYDSNKKPDIHDNLWKLITRIHDGKEFFRCGKNGTTPRALFGRRRSRECSSDGDCVTGANAICSLHPNN
jgi:hypothetical protein